MKKSRFTDERIINFLKQAGKGIAPLVGRELRARNRKAIPFMDGNKRKSLVIAELFLNLNSIEFTASDKAVAMSWLKLAAGDISEIRLEDRITANSRRMPKANQSHGERGT